RLVPSLAGTDDPDTAQRTRVRAALTAVHGALVHIQPGDDPDVVRTTALEAACAVLGLSARRANHHHDHDLQPGDHERQDQER
ncbi:MAG TPA: hypothetical protein VMD28_05225, partial [Acidimicrobiales bacterium]|nr:hypothetical protein [Acidimicrobiales bacterium]